MGLVNGRILDEPINRFIDCLIDRPIAQHRVKSVIDVADNPIPRLRRLITNHSGLVEEVFHMNATDSLEHVSPNTVLDWLAHFFTSPWHRDKRILIFR